MFAKALCGGCGAGALIWTDVASEVDLRERLSLSDSSRPAKEDLSHLLPANHTFTPPTLSSLSEVTVKMCICVFISRLRDVRAG